MASRPPRRPLALVMTVTVLALTVTWAVVAPADAAPPTAVGAHGDPLLAKKLTSVMGDARVQRNTSGAAVFDAKDGTELYARWGSRGTTPASNTKIFTAAAAMKTLGPSYRFKTEVIRRATVTKGVLNGRLYLKGYGDPTSGAADYASLAKNVRAQGIKRVTGSLVADATFFDSTRYNPYWSTSYASDYYAAQISALTLAPNADYDSGTVILRYGPGSRGKAAKITVIPASAKKYITITNKTTTGSKGTSNTVSARRSLTTGTITVSGRVPLGRAKSNKLITVNRPDLYAAAVFRAELAKVGVIVEGKTRSLATPASSRHLVARDTSMTLSKMLVPFLKLSNNMHAEALTKTMAARAGRAGSWTAGLAATTTYLTSLGVPMSGVRLVDGSGLTRSNTITPRAMATLLYRVQRESWFPAFYAALPVAANRARMTGGTLRNRMIGTKAANNAHAKTGSLTGVTALSGYVTGADGRRYVFSMLSRYRGSTPRPVENTLVTTLAGWNR